MKATLFTILLVLCTFANFSRSRLLTESSQARERQLSLKHKHRHHSKHKKRKLFFEFSWNVRKKKFFDQERMKKAMQHELEDMLSNYTMTRNMEWIKQDTMEEIANVFQKTMKSISNTKREILGKVDGLHIIAIRGE